MRNSALMILKFMNCHRHFPFAFPPFTIAFSFEDSQLLSTLDVLVRRARKNLKFFMLMSDVHKSRIYFLFGINFTPTRFTIKHERDIYEYK